MSLKKAAEKLSIKTILNKVSEEDLLRYYFGLRYNKKAFKSPFRRDIHPSCGLFVSKRGNILFKDFATGEVLTVFNMIAKKFNLTLWQVLKKVNNDLSLGLIERYTPTVNNEYKKLLQEEKEKINIVGKIRKFEKYDTIYWRQYGITKETLQKFNVYPLERVYIHRKLKYRNTPKNPIYGLLVDGKLKVYRPLANKKDKWRTDIRYNKFFGTQNLPFLYDYCFIVSSLKEVMTLYELGIPAIAPQQETCKVITYEGFSEIENPIFLFDYDQTGINESIKLMRKGYKAYFTGDTKAKDISDFYKKYGKRRTIELINKILLNEGYNIK